MAIGYQTIVGFMPRRNLLFPTLCIVLLIAAWTFRAPRPSFDHWLDNSAVRGATSSPSSPPPSSPPPSSVGAPTQSNNDVDLSAPDAPFVGWPLRRVCEEATWVPGLVYICDNNSGGIGNIRNYIHTCIRYGIEAGATGLVMPKIRKRNETDLADLFTDYLPFDYMFDEKHFRDALANCPQIILYDNVGDIPGVGRKPNIEHITPKKFGNREGCDWRDQNRHTDRFGDRFRRWLNDPKNGQSPPTKDHPRLIRFNWGVLWDWLTYRDGPEFANTFGGILKLNDQLLRLGNTALMRMRAFAKANGVEDGRFLGVHLRTESDALGFWPTYNTQTEAYLKQATQRGFEVAYIATGDPLEAANFAGAAIEMAQMRVVTKADLLDDEDMDELESLSWDQQGLIDLIVLLGSDFFAGTMPSSFSVYTAMKRHLRTGGVYTRPYKVGTEGDGLSYLVGNYEKYWEGWLFMWDGMWP